MSQLDEPKGAKKPAKDTTKKSGSTPKEWTIMVYMAGDNELSEDMITALKAMKAFAGNSNINIVALYDSNYPPVPVTFYDFTSPYVVAGAGTNPDLKAFADADIVRDILGIPVPTKPIPYAERYAFDRHKEFVPIKKFVPWVLKQPHFRAKKYALLLSGHSDGVIGRTIMRDDNPPNVLNLQKLGQVLEYCRKSLPRSTHPDQKFDLLGFDGCLMGMLETAYEMKDIADVMVASEGNIPNSGWDYQAVLTDLVLHNPTWNAGKFAGNIVSKYKGFNRDYIPSGRAISISAFDLSHAQSFARSINAIALLLYRNLKFNPNGKNATVRAVFRESFVDFVLRSHFMSQTFMHNQAVDIMDFLYNLLDHWYFFNEQHKKLSPKFSTSIFATRLIALENAYTTLVGIFGQLVIESCYAGAEYQFSKGVSLFFPWSQMALNLLSTQYKTVKFDREIKNWRLFFRKYVELTMRTDETPSFRQFVGVAPDPFVAFAAAKDVTGREYIGREYIGREYIGRGAGFYEHFEQMRNYSHFKKVTNPPPTHNEVDINGCNTVQAL